MLPGANLSRTISRSNPHLDWILIDQEHGNISDDSMHDAVAAVAACGVSPIVRVPEGQHWMIKRALDAGAHGIMVPLVQSVEQAKEIARFAKFPAAGKGGLGGNRGLGSPLSMEKFGTGVSQVQYFLEANEATLVILQIETQSALDQAAEIAAVSGVDVLFVGPTDLGNQIGHPTLKGEFAPELEDAIKQVHEAAKKGGKWSGIYCGSGEMAKKYADQGFGMVNTMNDVVAIGKGFGGAVTTAMGS